MDDLRHITSAANPLVKLARQLATRRRARYRERLFLLEGVRPISTAVHRGVRLQTLIVEDERRDDLDPALVASLRSRAERTVTMPGLLLSSFTDTEHPQPLAAIASLPDLTMPGNATSIVCLDAIRDPGNLGTIVRTAAAAGVDGIGLLPGCVDPFNPRVVRASAGLVTALPIATFPTIADLIRDCFENPEVVTCVAADAGGTLDYRDVDWKKPLVAVVGNEAAGLSEPARLAANLWVRIPMADGVDSLNVSAAMAVLLFEMRSQREHGIE